MPACPSQLANLDIKTPVKISGRSGCSGRNATSKRQFAPFVAKSAGGQQ